MKNKEILRKTTAFIAALSIVYATVITETDGVLVKGAETTAVSTDNTTAETTTDEGSGNGTTVTTVTTAATEETTTTTAVTVYSHSFSLNFDSDIDAKTAEDLAKRISGTNETEVKSKNNNSTFDCSFSSENKDFDLSEAVAGCKMFEKINSTNYLKTGNGDNMQYFSYSVSGTKVNFAACYYFVLTDKSKDLIASDGEFKTQDEGIKIIGHIFKRGNIVFVEKGLYLSTQARDGYKPRIYQVSVPKNSPNYEKDYYISCEITEDNNNYKVYMELKKGSEKGTELENQTFEKPLLKIERTNASRIGLQIDGKSYNNRNTLSWYEDRTDNLKITVDKDYAFDLLVEKKDSNGIVTASELLGEGRDFYDDNIFNKSELLKNNEYDSNLSVRIDGYIKHVQYDIYLDDKKKDAQGDYKVYKEGNKRFIDIPYFEYSNNETYFLEEIIHDETFNGESSLKSLEEVLDSASDNAFYKCSYENESDKITQLHYRKVQYGSSNITVNGILRNNESRTIKSNSVLCSLYNINFEENDSSYWILYKTSGSDFQYVYPIIKKENSSNPYSFSISTNGNDIDYINVISVMKKNGGKISQVKLNPSDMLFYFDKTAPTLTEDSMTMSQGSNKDQKVNKVSEVGKNTDIWYNSEMNLDVFVSDKTNGINNDEVRTKLDAISGNSSEITSIVISDTKPSDNNRFIVKNEFFEFSKNKNGSWNKTQSSQRAVDIDFNGDGISGYSPTADTKENSYTFSFKIKPIKEMSNINKQMYVTVYDINGNKTTVPVWVRYDGIAPDADKISLSDLQKNKDGKFVVLKDENQRFVLHSSVSASDVVDKDPGDVYYKIDDVDSDRRISIYQDNGSETENGSTSEVSNSDIEEYMNSLNNSMTVIPDSELNNISGSGVDDVIVEYIYNGQSEEFGSESNSEGSFADSLLMNEKIENTSGIIKVTVKDKAGNISESYYSQTGGLVTDPNNKSAEIIFDNAAPNCSINNNSVPDYGANWFKDFPRDIVIKYDDVKSEEGFSNSGIAALRFKLDINNGENDDYSCSISAESLPSNSGKLKFRSISGSNSEFTVSLEFDSTEIMLFEGETIKFPKDNAFTISVAAVDYAGNRSDSKSESKISFNIDRTAPSFAAKYTIDEEVSSTPFGTFSKDAVTIRVTMIEDFNASGIDHKNVILFHGNTPYPAERIEKVEGTTDQWVCVFTVPEGSVGNTVFDGDLSIMGADNVGNVCQKKALTSGSSGALTIERIPPRILFDKDMITAYDPDSKLISYFEESNTIGQEDKLWFNRDVNLMFEAVDEHSGLAEVSRIINHLTESEAYRLPLAENFYHEKDVFNTDNDILNSKTYTLSTKNDKFADGGFEFIVKSVDNSGNNSDDKRFVVYKDVTAPLITRFEYSTEPGNKESNINDYRNTDLTSLASYRHFSNTKDTITVRVYAEDSGASSGIKTITLKRTGAAAMENQAHIDRENGGAYADFDIPNDFKGTLFAIAEDNVGNTPGFWAQSNGYINETEDKHKEEDTPYIIHIPDTNYKDISGNNLYKENFNATVTVKDTFSGIHSIEVISPGNGESVSLETSIDDPDRNMEGWTSEEKDLNLQTKISRNISQVIDDLTNKNGNQIILKATDNAGNVFDTQPVLYSFDSTVPVINVSFDNNSADSEFKNYYKAPRQATVTVNERNFDPTRVSSSAAFGGSWNLVKGETGIEGSEYQNTVTFNSDGVYKLRVECSDMADNIAVPSDSGEFIIDQTAPVINVYFDNNSSSNSNYFSQNRTAYIEVNDVNFESGRVSVTGSKDSRTEDFPVKNGRSLGNSALTWQNVGGNVWRTSVPITEDGYYEFNVTAQDKAGNSAQPYHTTFYIDKAAPQINISGIEDNHAYNGEFRPVIEINDRNIDLDSVSISMNGSKNKDRIKLEGTVEKTDSKYVFIANDIAHEKENDDIYTISVNANDKSGNPSVKNIKVSVNRFGSTFELDEYADSIKDKSVKEIKDIVIHEINPDKHSDSFKPSVRVIKDGSNTVLEDSDVGLDIKLSNDSKTGWYDYVYTIKSSNFENDGVYEIMIFTEDKAGNKNYSESLLNFKVDKTNPEIYYQNIVSKGVYKGESKQVTAVLNDNLGIDPDSISVLINGKEIDKSDFSYDPDKRECTFSIPNQSFNQNIEVLACDTAGNPLDPAQAQISDVFVSTSTAQILMHKLWFKIALAAAALLAAAGAVIFIVKKKRESK